MSLTLSVASYADEVFTATAYTGIQYVGSQIDVAYAGSHLAWINFSAYYIYDGSQWYSGNPPQGNAVISDTGANLDSSGIASDWVLWYANWESGNGYAVLTIDTDNPPGIYAVGTVNCTGGVIWVFLN